VCHRPEAHGGQRPAPQGRARRREPCGVQGGEEEQRQGDRRRLEQKQLHRRQDWVCDLIAAAALGADAAVDDDGLQRAEEHRAKAQRHAARLVRGRRGHGRRRGGEPALDGDTPADDGEADGEPSPARQARAEEGGEDAGARGRHVAEHRVQAGVDEAERRVVRRNGDGDREDHGHHLPAIEAEEPPAAEGHGARDPLTELRGPGMRGERHNREATSGELQEGEECGVPKAQVVEHPMHGQLRHHEAD